MRNKILLCYCFAVLLACSSIFAEVIYLNNGNKVSGKIISQDEDKIVVRIGEEDDATDITFFSDEIKSMEKEETPLPQPIVETLAPPKAETQVEPKPELEVKPKPEVRVESKAEAVIESSPEIAPQTAPSQELTQQQILEGLSSLLDKEELEYFARINSMSSDVVNKAIKIMAGPPATTTEPTQLPQLIQDLSLGIANIITQINNVQPPPLFVNFHRIYLENLNLLKDVLVNMAGGNLSVSQEKILALQDNNLKIQQELNRILTERKKKTEGEKANVSS